MNALEGAPILCKRCGAPTDPQPDLGVRCRFCGTADRLPPDQLGRALEIKGRLAMAAAQSTQVAASEAALASLFERPGAFWSVLGPFPFVAAVVIVYAIWSTLTTLDGLPPSVPLQTRVQLITAAAYGPLFILGITVSLPFSLWVGRFSYRRSVRGKLIARPPLYPGAPMRCRACGAHLPVARETFVSCAYCRTSNLLAAAAAADAKRQLDDEVAGYRARASGLLTSSSQTGVHMSRVLVICFVLVYAAVLGLGAVSSWLVGMLG